MNASKKGSQSTYYFAHHIYKQHDTHHKKFQITNPGVQIKKLPASKNREQ